MTRRRATILLHWLNGLLLIQLFAGGLGPILGWSFVLSAFAMCGLALAKGLMNGPGPKLEGVVRAAHPWLSRFMYLGLFVTACITALALTGNWTGSAVTLDEVYFYLIGVSGLHALFHFWRHSSLGDGALRRITPKAVHAHL